MARVAAAIFVRGTRFRPLQERLQECMPQFRELVAEIRACTVCMGKGDDLPLGPRPIFQADPAARILLSGQAPGRITHAKGVPFDDPSGDRLRAWLGVDRATFYDPTKFAVVPMGFCFPGTGKGGDLPPRPECAPLWRDRLIASLPNIELFVMMGRYTIDWHLKPAIGTPLGDIAREWRKEWPARIALPHSSPRNQRWFREHPWFEAEVLPALRARVAEILAISA